MEGKMTERHYMAFNADTFGSKYGPSILPIGIRKTVYEFSVDEALNVVMETPSIWIGEVSWLKAAVFEDADEYVPNAVQTIHELIGEEFPVLNEELKMKILDALKLDNSTAYAVADPETVGKFLDEHMGKKLFTVSW
jgi:hypothetical protein